MGADRSVWQLTRLLVQLKFELQPPAVRLARAWVVSVRRGPGGRHINSLTRTSLVPSIA